MPHAPEDFAIKPKRKPRPFRRAVLRGLGVLMPPLLTIVLFLWAWNLITAYVLEPVETTARIVITWAIWDVHNTEPGGAETKEYVMLNSGKWIPRAVYRDVNADPGSPAPHSAVAFYHRYVELHYLRPTTVVPLFFALFILTLYLMGKFLAGGIGRWTWSVIEGLINRLPVIRNVYSSVKQVTDFVFSEQDIQFNRVVAVEYPRKGIWSIGFVTGESMLDIRSAANEPVVSVLMPTSPMPATGFTITIRKSETIDLDITIDQAIQFVVSCGVVIPLQQQITDRQFAPITSKIIERDRAIRMNSGSSQFPAHEPSTDESASGEEYSPSDKNSSDPE